MKAFMGLSPVKGRGISVWRRLGVLPGLVKTLSVHTLACVQSLVFEIAESKN
jgi:hypothetical protein